jgi:hypothetical protein
MTTCPKECEDDRANMKTQLTENKKSIRDLFILAIPAWVRGLFIAVIGILFLLYGGQWLYNVSTFATKEDLREVKIDLKEEIVQGFELMQAKLEKGK